MIQKFKRLWHVTKWTLTTKWRILKLFFMHAIQWKRLGEISLTRTEGIIHRGEINVIAVLAQGCHRIRIQGQPSLPGDIDTLRIWLNQPSATITVPNGPETRGIKALNLQKWPLSTFPKCCSVSPRKQAFN